MKTPEGAFLFCLLYLNNRSLSDLFTSKKRQSRRISSSWKIKDCIYPLSLPTDPCIWFSFCPTEWSLKNTLLCNFYVSECPLSSVDRTNSWMWKKVRRRLPIHVWNVNLMLIDMLKDFRNATVIFFPSYLPNAYELFLFNSVIMRESLRRKHEQRLDKTNKMNVRPAKTQISLGIRPVWSESSLCAQWVAKNPSFLRADSEDSDQTGRIPRLIWVFAGRTFILLVLSCRGSH